MLNKHNNMEAYDNSTKVTSANNDTATITSANNDSVDVTLANYDATTPDPTINTTSNTATNTIYQTIMVQLDQVCFYFLKGICNYGDQCRKRHYTSQLATCPICCLKFDKLGHFKYHFKSQHEKNAHDPNQLPCDQCDLEYNRENNVTAKVTSANNDSANVT